MQIIGLLLNMSHFTCDSCSKPHELFGSSAKFTKAATELNLDVLGEPPSFNLPSSFPSFGPLLGACRRGEEGLQTDGIGKIPLVTQVSDGGDDGLPIMVQERAEGEEVRSTMRSVGEKVWEWLYSRPISTAGTRG